MRTLSPQPFTLGSIYMLAKASHERKSQVLLNARADDGFIAQSSIPLLEKLLPLGNRPDGVLGDLLANLGEWREADGNVAILGKRRDGTAYALCGERLDVIGATRLRFLEAFERRTHIGTQQERYEAGLMIAALKGDRPMLRAVA